MRRGRKKELEEGLRFGRLCPWHWEGRWGCRDGFQGFEVGSVCLRKESCADNQKNICLLHACDCTWQ